MNFFMETKRYNLGLSLVNRRVNVDFRTAMIDAKLSVKKFILDELNSFSEREKNGLNNSKYIDMDSVKIEKDEVFFTLCSEKELTAPGKSLKKLSNQLLSNPYFEKLKTNDGKLFKTYTFVNARDDQNAKIKPVPISDLYTDADLVKALVDYLTEPQFPYTPERNNKRNAVEKMKLLAVKAGLLENKEVKEK